MPTFASNQPLIFLCICRFLLKDKDTSYWEDVGDDIAREKTSQVLRDAVAEKNGPMRQPRTKTKSPPRETTSRGQSRICSNKEVETDYDPIPIARAMTREAKSSSAQQMSSSSGFVHPYQEYAASFGPSTSCIPPPYPSVTPATDQTARKRPRDGDVSPFYTFNSAEYVSPHGRRDYDNRNPVDMMMRSPMNPTLSHPSNTFHSHLFSQRSARRHSPASASIPEHYAPRSSRGNEPWLADVNSQPRFADTVATARLQVHAHHYFDPYNEAILSDHDGDGSVSSIMYPKNSN
jgi:hypothetical protein